MVAETHSLTEPLDVEDVLTVLAAAAGVAPEGAAGVALRSIELDDTLAVLDLCEVVADELAERSVAHLELDDELPATLGELAVELHAALTAGRRPDR